VRRYCNDTDHHVKFKGRSIAPGEAILVPDGSGAILVGLVEDPSYLQPRPARWPYREGPVAKVDAQAAEWETCTRTAEGCETCQEKGHIDSALGGTGTGALLGLVPCPDCAPLGTYRRPVPRCDHSEYATGFTDDVRYCKMCPAKLVRRGGSWEVV
jgi:hypothetical protein